MGIDCNFYIVVPDDKTSKVVLDHIKTGITTRQFPCVDSNANITICTNANPYITDTNRYKIELQESFEVSSTCAYVMITKWVYVTSTLHIKHIINIDCWCRFEKLSGIYTTKLMKKYMNDICGTANIS